MIKAEGSDLLYVSVVVIPCGNTQLFEKQVKVTVQGIERR